MIELTATTMVATSVATLSRIRDVKFAPAMAAPQKPGQKGFTTSYGAPSRTELAGCIIRNQPLVPFVGIPADITIMMIADQNIPIL